MSRLPVPTGIVVVYNAGGSGERGEIESIGRPGFALAEVLSAGTHIYTVAPEMIDHIASIEAMAIVQRAELNRAATVKALLVEALGAMILASENIEIPEGGLGGYSGLIAAEIKAQTALTAARAL